MNKKIGYNQSEYKTKDKLSWFKVLYHIEKRKKIYQEDNKFHREIILFI